MFPDLPLVFFGAVAALSAGLALMLRRANKAVAMVAAGLAILSLLLVLNERLSARVSIRVDLLVTIPIVSAASVVVGLFAWKRPPLTARIPAVLLVLIGGATFVQFSWMMAKSAREARRLTAISRRARRLYYEETIRCHTNLSKRFGTLERHDHPCLGQLAVISRTSGAYPFTRAIVNDAGQLFLMFSPEPGIEDNWSLDDGPSALLKQGAGDVLSGSGTPSGGRIRIQLQPSGAENCEAKIDRGVKTESLVLARRELPACNLSAETPQVRFVGAYGIVAPVENNYFRLVQVWLWETGDAARGLFLTDLAPHGLRRDFQFPRQLRGSRRAQNEWELRAAGPENGERPETITCTLTGGRVRLAGSSALLGSAGQMFLDPQEVISNPKVSLAPLEDRDRFFAYFDSVFFNLNLSWTAP
ncbi:MAG TPA: hypothetical protein VJN43_18540 [Bryobacteraceae bacterium]|nr:hypothetical protein [Bryobacteraceae bacterium]